MTDESTPNPQATPAGWYPDPELAGTQRYWDGRAWTQHRHPPAPVAPRPIAQSNDLALAGFICGVVGIFFGLIPFTWFIAIPLGIAALVCGVLGYRTANEKPNVKHKDLATWGIGLGAVAVIFGIIGVVLLTQFIDDVDEVLEENRPEIQREIDEIQREIDEFQREFDQEFDQRP